jgi:hypothetical protein
MFFFFEKDLSSCFLYPEIVNASANEGEMIYRNHYDLITVHSLFKSELSVLGKGKGFAGPRRRKAGK